MTVMRYCICFALCILFTASVQGQSDRNKKPKIVGQSPVSTNEEQSVTITFSHLQVRDDDNWFYPWGFTLSVYPGENYTINNNTVTPNQNFYGTLSVPVTVNDGQNDSDVYNLQVTIQPINDAPMITAQGGPISTEQSTPFDILFSHLIVSDPDNVYPSGFSLMVQPSSNGTYTVSGNQVTPAPSVVGPLAVTVQVSDGSAASNLFTLNVDVKPRNQPPVITGQTPMVMEEDATLQLQFNQLVVSDPDNSYPIGFRLNVYPGTGYSVANTSITPEKNFAGNLIVGVTVNDGRNESNVFNLLVNVTPLNDAPQITRIEQQPLRYAIGKGPALITTEFEAEDVDNDSLMSAEIGISADQYRPGNDELAFKTEPGIKGAFDLQRGMVTFSGPAPINAYVKTIRTLTYNYFTGGEPLRETKTIFFRVNDGKSTSETVVRQLTTNEQVINLDIPTAFTPNGDFANDTWQITPLKQEDAAVEAVIRIYNRFGRLLYEMQGFEKPWDGKLNGEQLPADTYYYTIEFKTGTWNALKGIVAILR
jgi:gliding motility-associated-like protein